MEQVSRYPGTKELGPLRKAIPVIPRLMESAILKSAILIGSVFYSLSDAAVGFDATGLTTWYITSTSMKTYKEVAGR